MSVSLPRALSKLGLCSRAEGVRLVEAGRVRVNGVVRQEISLRVDPARDRLTVDGEAVEAAKRVYLALNKPRGLVTTRSDPQGRETVYSCLTAADLPFVAPVGRLDKASEGLLLLTNDTRWAAGILDPAAHVDKTYRVQIRWTADADALAALCAALVAGVIDAETGETLAARAASPVQAGGRTAWIELVLDEGRNRQIRRMFDAREIEVLRLMRIAIGGLALGTLGKGEWRKLNAAEVRMLARKAESRGE